MTPALAILAAAFAAGPLHAPVRVVEVTDTRLALEIRPMPPLADGAAATTPSPRTILFTRGAANAPWVVASGLANAEVVGEPNLFFPATIDTPGVAKLDASIGAVAGEGVTVIDLIEGDVAICVWEGRMVRSVFFADEFIPATAASRSSGRAKNPLLLLAFAHRPDGAPIARGAIIAAQSRTAIVAQQGRTRAAAATVVAAGERMQADLEICTAVLNYAQPAIDPKLDSQYQLYLGLARLLDSSEGTNSASD